MNIMFRLCFFINNSMFLILAYLAGLAFWGADWLNEIANGLFLVCHGFCSHLANEAHRLPNSGGTNIETMFMFAVAGIVWTKMLHPEKETKFLGLPNRWTIAIIGSVFCVIIEYLLNSADALTWEWVWWWSSMSFLIFLFGYLWFFMFAFWVYYMKTMHQKLIAVGTIWAVDIAALIVFAGFLRWICLTVSLCVVANEVTIMSRPQPK